MSTACVINGQAYSRLYNDTGDMPPQPEVERAFRDAFLAAAREAAAWDFPDVDAIEHGLSLGLNPNFYFHHMLQRILAANKAYRNAFGHVDGRPIRLLGHTCYEISHHFDRPCDQCGESCPRLCSRFSSASIDGGRMKMPSACANTSLTWRAPCQSISRITS